MIKKINAHLIDQRGCTQVLIQNMGSEGVQFITNTWLIATLDCPPSHTPTGSTSTRRELDCLGYRMAMLAAPHQSLKQRSDAATQGLSVELWDKLTQLQRLTRDNNTSNDNVQPLPTQPSPITRLHALGESLQQLLLNTKKFWLKATTRDAKRALLGCFKGCVGAAAKAIEGKRGVGGTHAAIVFDFMAGLLEKCSDMVCDNESPLLKELVDRFFRFVRMFHSCLQMRRTCEVKVSMFLLCFVIVSPMILADLESVTLHFQTMKAWSSLSHRCCSALSTPQAFATSLCKCLCIGKGLSI